MILSLDNRHVLNQKRQIYDPFFLLTTTETREKIQQEELRKTYQNITSFLARDYLIKLRL